MVQYHCFQGCQININAIQIFLIVMYIIDIIDSIQRDAAKNLLGSENFRKKMSSLLITCCSWSRCLYPHLCLFMFCCCCCFKAYSQSFAIFVCLFLLSSPWTQCRKHNLVPLLLLLFVYFIVVTMDAMQETHSKVVLAIRIC